MFTRLFAFQNGRPISDLWDFKARHNRVKDFEPVPRPEFKTYIKEDYYCYRIGCLDRDMKKGEYVHVKLSDARRLYDLLKDKFRG